MFSRMGGGTVMSLTEHKSFFPIASSLMKAPPIRMINVATTSKMTAGGEEEKKFSQVKSVRKTSALL